MFLLLAFEVLFFSRINPVPGIRGKNQQDFLTDLTWYASEYTSNKESSFYCLG